jgi:hypothetical protein
VNSKIKVSDLRDPEIKQKSEHTCEKWICFESEKSIAVQATRFQSFKISEGKRKTTLDFKYQKLKMCEGKNKGGSNIGSN